MTVRVISDDLTPDMLPCPKCYGFTLDYDLRPTLAKRPTTWMGIPAVEVAVKTLPVIWCTLPFCDFEQWGRSDGVYAIFDGTPGTVQ